MAYIGKAPGVGIRNRFIFTATAGQTVFSGVDDYNLTLSYTDAQFTDVFLNGVKLDKTDYTATSGTSIVLAEAAALNDTLEVLAFDTFSVFSGEFSQDVTVGGTITTDGLIVDTNTLYVDSTNNRVGIGTTLPEGTLHVENISNNSIIMDAPANRFNSIGFQTAGVDKWWLGRADSDQIAGDAFFIGIDNGNLTDAGGLSNKLVITQSGNVGIGASSPSAKLDLVLPSPAATASSGGLEITEGTKTFAISTTGSSYNYAGVGGNELWYYGNSNFGALTFGSDGSVPIKFISNGSERMRIDSSGNVGIGDSSPLNASGYTTLSLNDTTGSLVDLRVNDGNAFRIQAQAGSSQLINIYNQPMTFHTNDAERMRIDSSGNLLVGKSVTTLSTDGIGLAASGEGRFTRDGDYPLLLNRKTSDGGLVLFYKDGTPVGSIGSGGGGMTFGSGSSGTERMRIDSSGNVMSGVTSTDAKLYVTNGASPQSRLIVGGGGGAANTLYTILAGGNNIQFETNGSERMRIDSSGGVLIANTTNNIANGGIILRPSGDTYYGITTAWNTLHVFDYTNSLYRFYVSGNGGISNYSANNVNLSDQREKKNITDAASTWTDIKNFSIKEFHYNSEDDADPKKIGVIAQDVQESNANLVSTFNVDDDTQRLAVKEQQITWMAIKALQEAITKIETLETQNADFETRLAALEAN